jgi:hypothetical protein
MALSRSLIRRLTRLHDREVIITDHTNWRRNKPLTGRVIGWSFDKEHDDEPLVEVRYSSDLPESWAGQVDNLSLNQIQLANQPVAIPACQRKLVRHGA